MTASVHERLTDDAEDFCPRPPQRIGRHTVCDVQTDLAIDGQPLVDFDEPGEELNEWPVLLASQPQIVGRAAQLPSRPLERRRQPSQPFRCLRVSQAWAGATRLGQGVGQFLERLVVEVASDSLPLVVPNLNQTLLRLRPYHRRGDHVRHTLQEVEVVRGEGSPLLREGPEGAKRLLPAGNHHRRRAHRVAFGQKRRDAKPVVRRYVV